MSVSSIVRALAGGGLRERNVRILCVGLLVSTLLAAPPFARAQQGGAETTPPASGPAPDARQKTLRYSRFRSMLRTGDSIGDIKTGNLCASQMLLVMNARTEQAVMAPASRAVREEFLKAGLSDPVRGVVAPAGTPRDIVDVINRAVRSVLAEIETQATFQRYGLFAEGSTPSEFERIIRAELTKWSRALPLSATAPR